MRTISYTPFLVALALTIGFAPAAQAVPGFARQTQLECRACHTRFPELNAFGRQFKLGGYTLTSVGQIKNGDAQANAKSNYDLKLGDLPEISVMLQSAYTSVAKTVPGTQNGNVEMVQQASLFLAGAITSKIGSFIQFTYSQADGALGVDNADVRYADSSELGGTHVQWGLTLNNNPSIEDLWNSSPAWGFRWAGPSAAPSPTASPLIDGGLAQDVTGIGGYASFDNGLYFAGSLYRSSHLGTDSPGPGDANTIQGFAPYWRLAWQNSWGPNYLMVGAYGMHTKLFPAGVGGLTDGYDDRALDFQYERQLDTDSLTVRGTVIRETRDLAATFAAEGATAPGSDLTLSRIDAEYHFGSWTALVGMFNTTGSADALLYPANPIDGSANGSPSSSGWIAQAAYFPWQNVQLIAQYTSYSKFNGGSGNYDGSGRNASDNNVLYLGAWFAW